MGHYNLSLSIDATIMVSKNCPITGEHVYFSSRGVYRVLKDFNKHQFVNNA